MDLYFTIISKRGSILLLICAILTSALITPHQIQAETGEGTDVFRVIVPIFGVDKSKGDMVAAVTVNDGEASRVKFLDAEAPYVITTINDTGTSRGLIEYVATFPNVTVNAGDEYKACVVPLKNLDVDGLICKTGLNSPAARPEFVDISLNETTTEPVEGEED